MYYSPVALGLPLSRVLGSMVASGVPHFPVRKLYWYEKQKRITYYINQFIFAKFILMCVRIKQLILNFQMFQDIIFKYTCYFCLVRFPCLSGFHMLDNFLQPNLQSKPQREGTESEQFWDLLGGKSEYPSQKIIREPDSDPHLFSCSFSKGKDYFLASLKDLSNSPSLLKINSWLIYDGFLLLLDWTMCRKFKGEYTHWSLSLITIYLILEFMEIQRHDGILKYSIPSKYFNNDMLFVIKNVNNAIHFKHKW